MLSRAGSTGLRRVSIIDEEVLEEGERWKVVWLV